MPVFLHSLARLHTSHTITLYLPPSCLPRTSHAPPTHTLYASRHTHATHTHTHTQCLPPPPTHTHTQHLSCSVSSEVSLLKSLDLHKLRELRHLELDLKPRDNLGADLTYLSTKIGAHVKALTIR